MSIFRDPLYHYSEITGSNSLDPRIENFLNLNNIAAFEEAIRNLVEIRRVLSVANSIGRFAEISYREQYTQAIQWLNKQIPLTSFTSVQQIANYTDIEDTVASNFNSYVSQLKSYLSSQSLYQQIQIMQGVIQNQIVSDISDKVVAPITEDFNRHLLDSKSEVTESMEQTKQANESQLNKVFNDQLSSIRVTGEDAISQFEQARALANWSEFYAQKVKDYKLMVYGRPYQKRFLNDKLARFRLYRKSLDRKTRFKTILQARHGIARCTSEISSYLLTRLTSYSGKRTFWFSLLALGVLATMSVNIASIYDANDLLGIDFTRLRPTHNDTQLFAKLFVYISAFLIPTLGYSFANKNYRIYSNLLEQYNHREVVAQTIQGILAKPRGDEDDEKVRHELANVAATALFEQKTVGHLSKNESNSASLLDIMRLFRS